MVRQLILDQPIRGSNPLSPAKLRLAGGPRCSYRGAMRPSRSTGRAGAAHSPLGATPRRLALRLAGTEDSNPLSPATTPYSNSGYPKLMSSPRTRTWFASCDPETTTPCTMRTGAKSGTRNVGDILSRLSTRTVSTRFPRAAGAFRPGAVGPRFSVEPRGHPFDSRRQPVRRDRPAGMCGSSHRSQRPQRRGREAIRSHSDVP